MLSLVYLVSEAQIKTIKLHTTQFKSMLTKKKNLNLNKGAFKFYYQISILVYIDTLIPASPH